MRSSFVILLLCVFTSQQTYAGPWPREKGSGFAAVSGTITSENDTSGSTYLEYGLSGRATLGLDLNFGLDRTGVANGAGTVFLRFPFGPEGGTHLFAWHLGLGGRFTGVELSPALEAGVSWGRGVKWRENWGWATVDASVNLASAPASTRTKIDGTFGMGISPDIKVMLQVFNTFEDGQVFSEIAPSLLWSPGKSGKTTLQMGVEVPVSGGGDTQLKLGLWRDF